MPLRAEQVLSGGEGYPDPFVSALAVANLRVDVSTLSNREIDANGYLKPGTILQKSGAKISAAAQTAYGVVRFPVKVAADNQAGSIAAAADIDVAVVTHGVLSQPIAEQILGSVLTANELASLTIAAAGSNILLR